MTAFARFPVRSRVRQRRVGLTVGASLLCVIAVACAPSGDDTAAAPEQTTTARDACKDPATIESGVLTIATDSPAYDPWFSDDDPTNGKGYESAVAYAVAGEMGFPAGDVTWTTQPFNASYQPGPKQFDFDINQISISPQRAKAVTFSEGYYSAAQAIITLRDSPYAKATSLAEFFDATLAAQVGTTSLDAITNVVQTDSDPRVFDDTNAAANALRLGQVDGIVVDLPTAFYISAVEIPNSVITGQFQPEAGATEQFGLLFEKGNALVTCANQAIEALKADGTLAAIEDRWLSSVVDVPKLDA